MAKKTEKTTTVTVVLNQIKVGTHEDVLSFGVMKMDEEGNNLMAEIVRDTAGVRVKIDLPTPDPKFPPIVQEGKVKSFKIGKAVDVPKITGLTFTSHQIDQIANYIRDKQELKVTFTLINPKLPGTSEQTEKGPF